MWGPRLGIDFAGGSLVQVRFAEPTKTDTIRQALTGIESGALDIQDLGGAGTEFLIRVPQADQNAEGVNRRLTGALAEKFGQDKVQVLRVEAVGPRVGQDLRRKAILAVAFATLMMATYISLRFEWRFGVGAAIALVHDVLIAVGALVLSGFEFDLIVVPALLTVVGLFGARHGHRLGPDPREPPQGPARARWRSIINRSINETLSRSILTSGTAVLVVLALFHPRRPGVAWIRLYAADRVRRRHLFVDLHRQPGGAVFRARCDDRNAPNVAPAARRRPAPHAAPDLWRAVMRRARRRARPEPDGGTRRHGARAVTA